MTARPILVTGARGQVARALAERGTARGSEIVALGRPELDLGDPDTLGRAMGTLKPALVINAAAYTMVDQAESEPERAFAINADGAGDLARLCAQTETPMVQLSTDYVFDGMSAAPYRPDDPTRPLNTYGRSKLAGEERIRRVLASHIIVRTCWVFDRTGANFLTAMLRLAAERTELSIVDDQVGSPTFAPDLAAGLLAIVERVLTNGSSIPWGTYHLTAAGATSWYGFAREIFRIAGSHGQTVPSLLPVSSEQFGATARRPANSVLDCSAAQDAFGVRLPEWRDAVMRCMTGVMETDP